MFLRSWYLVEILFVKKTYNYIPSLKYAKTFYEV